MHFSYTAANYHTEFVICNATIVAIRGTMLVQQQLQTQLELLQQNRH
jgi:hypothetical protein